MDISLISGEMLVQISWLTIYGIHGVINQRTKLWGPQLVANNMDQDYNDCKVKSCYYDLDYYNV